MAKANPAVATSWADATRWDDEYRSIRAIPSSHRLMPSHAFLRLAPLMHLPSRARVLDAGAGTGRHSTYLAVRGCDVYAVDASGVACETLRERADRLKREPMLGSISVEHAVLDLGDIPADTYDLVIDSYVSCHLLDEEERLRYLASLLTLVRPGGFLYTSCMGAGDSYYSAHREMSTGLLATDPLNGVTKRLQSQASFEESAGALAIGATAVTERFVDDVDGVPYDREVVAAILPAPG